MESFKWEDQFLLAIRKLIADRYFNKMYYNYIEILEGKMEPKFGSFFEKP